MQNTNWENFLKNLGEWRGSFSQISPQGDLLSSTPSLLSLEGAENNTLVRFRVRRYASEDLSQPPTQDYSEEYRSLGKQIIFFDTGAFSKGSLQFAPFCQFGAEYGFISENRRLRLVQLFDSQGNFSSLTLIREFRSQSLAQECPPLQLEQLLGEWSGEACTAFPEWKPAEVFSTHLQIKQISPTQIEQTLSFANQQITSVATIEGQKLRFNDGATPREILLLPDGASSNVPLQLQLRQPFFVEVGWLLAPDRRERLVRSYNDQGAWVSSTYIIERKVA
jgi:hypothetical protein